MARPPVGELGKLQLLELYHYLKLNRMVEEKLTNLYRQGKVEGGLYRSLGQEACSVGAAYALADDDVFTPLIRNLGAIFVRGGRPRDIFCQYMARRDGPTRGRDLNTHFGWLEPGDGIEQRQLCADVGLHRHLYEIGAARLRPRPDSGVSRRRSGHSP